MRLLLYGFGPYPSFRTNITEAIVRRFPKHRWTKKVVFPVRFRKSQFINAVRDYRPDVILGLGQCSRGLRLRLESTAVNRRRGSKTDKERPIVAAGFRRLSTNLKLNLGREARFSRNAGNYVCNYSMYIILDFLKRRRLATRFGFVHVPCGYNFRKAIRSLEKAIGKIETD